MDEIDTNSFTTERTGVVGTYPRSFMDSISGGGISLRQRNLAMLAYRNEVDQLTESLENSLLSNRDFHKVFREFESKSEAAGPVLARIHTAKNRAGLVSGITGATFQGVRDALVKTLWETWKGTEA